MYKRVILIALAALLLVAAGCSVRGFPDGLDPDSPGQNNEPPQQGGYNSVHYYKYLKYKNKYIFTKNIDTKKKT